MTLKSRSRNQAENTNSNNDIDKRSNVPVNGDPPFKLKDLKDAIPAHCFEKSLFKSTMYLIVDLALVFGLFYIGLQVYYSHLPVAVKAVFWLVYWLCQGCVSFSVWIIAHECGHYSYCDSKTVCDWLGLFLHTVLLVPYHSWRISHSKHHKNTNRMDGDEAFVPMTRSELQRENNLEFPSFWRRFAHTFRYLTIGFPSYLIFHARGRKYGQHVDHFIPKGPLFSNKEYLEVVISDVGIFVWLGFLGYLAYIYGPMWVVFLYGIPYLNVNMWLVIVTYLQHTDLKVPHYDDEEWTWLKGALCTMDRDYGVLNYVFHNLTDAHVAHHLFSYMPHYHLKEATKYIKPILGKYYNYDDTPVWKALWKCDSYCRFVEDHGGVRWYKYDKQQ